MSMLGEARAFWMGGVALVLLGSTQACGSAKDIGDGDDGRRRPTTTVVDDDEVTFELVSMTPDAGSSLATPLSIVELTFNLDVDPSSVEGIRLRERESERTVAAELEVEGKIVRIVPSSPLSEGYRYTVSLADVRSTTAEANSITEDARFATNVNFPVLYLRYQNGVAERAHEYSWDPSTGKLEVSHWTAGQDGVVLSPDDLQDTRVVSLYDEHMDNVSSDVRAGAGADGVYDTADDQQVYLREATFEAAGLTTRTHTFYGADLTAGTADDHVELTSYTYDAGDRLVRVCEADSCSSYRYEGANRFEVLLTDPGADEQWDTADDIVGPEYTRMVSDERGLEVSSEVHQLTTDGVVDPSDQTLVSYTNVTYDERGLATEVLVFDGAGQDGIWRTADDAASTRYVMTYDEDGFRRTRHVYGVGQDGLPNTADDELKNAFFYQADSAQ